VPNNAPNSVFVFKRIVLSERLRIVSLYNAELETVSARCSRLDDLILGDDYTNEGERVMAKQRAGTAVISEGHKEVVNIRTAGAASKCSAGNTIRILIRPNNSQNYSYSAKYSKLLFGTIRALLGWFPALRFR